MAHRRSFGFLDSSPQDISCVKTGQILDVDLSESGTGMMLAKRVELEENVNMETLKGTITSVDSPTQFHLVVFNEEPAINGVSEGALVVALSFPPPPSKSAAKRWANPKGTGAFCLPASALQPPRTSWWVRTCRFARGPSHRPEASR